MVTRPSGRPLVAVARSSGRPLACVADARLHVYRSPACMGGYSGRPLSRIAPMEAKIAVARSRGVCGYSRRPFQRPHPYTPTHPPNKISFDIKVIQSARNEPPNSPSRPSLPPPPPPRAPPPPLYPPTPSPPPSRITFDLKVIQSSTMSLQTAGEEGRKERKGKERKGKDNDKD